MIENNKHHVMIRNRNSVELTGITKIESVNKNEFVLETTFGVMYIFGSDLEIKSLDIDKGALDIIGNVTAIEYDDHKLGGKPKKSFISKLFK